jgi:DNA-binding IclR family transcriptional regulator
LVKALQLLNLFALKNKELTLKEMIDALNFHKSSVQRIVMTLESEGYLQRDSINKRAYRLGKQILILGSIASQDFNLARIAKAALEKLVELTKETAHLCVEDRNQCLYIAKEECEQSIKVVSRVGQRLPLHCSAVGKCLLSGMDEERIDRVIAECGLQRFTKNTLVTRKDILDECKKIKLEQVAIDNEEIEVGLRCIGAPIFDKSARVIAAISISGPKQRIPDEKITYYAKHVKDAAANISAIVSEQKINQ